jgi:hypothetical protein
MQNEAGNIRSGYNKVADYGGQYSGWKSPHQQVFNSGVTVYPDLVPHQARS